MSNFIIHLSVCPSKDKGGALRRSLTQQSDGGCKEVIAKFVEKC
jgi:hypothetical protein